MKKFISILILVFVFNSIIFACSIGRAPDPPIAKASKQTYIFVGEVIGYTEIIKSKIKSGTFQGNDKFYGEGRGLKIKPLEIINIPDSAGDYVELYKFGVTSWCLPDIVDAPFPIGTKLEIIANEATVLANKNSENHVRLESKIFDSLSVVKDSDEFNTTADSVFDYGTWKSLQAKIQPERNYAFSNFMFAEINKDLLRLEKAVTKQERYAILERLLYAPNIDFPKIVSPKIGALRIISFGKYERLPNIAEGSSKKIKITSTEKKLLKKREEIEKSGYFNFQQVGFFINKK
jgi:hypothetical protein